MVYITLKGLLAVSAAAAAEANSIALWDLPSESSCSIQSPVMFDCYKLSPLNVYGAESVMQTGASPLNTGYGKEFEISN